MRVIFINNGALTESSSSGGCESFIQIGKRLLKRNINVALVTSYAGKIQCERDGFFPEFIITDYNRIDTKNLVTIVFHYFKRMIKSYLILRSTLNKKQDVVLYATSDFFYDIFPLIMLRAKKKIMALHMIYLNPLRNNFGNHSSINYLLCFLSQKLSLYFHYIDSGRIVYIHPSMVSYIRKFCMANRCDFISNGVDNNFADRIKIKEKIYDGCWIGRLHQQKGVEDLFKIWNIVVKQYPDAQLILCGKGTEKLFDTVEKYGLKKNIVLKGFVDNETKIKIMKQSKFFLFPSYYESWPITICEAMSCNIPVIAYDLPVYKPVFIRGIEYVYKGDIGEFANTITQLLKDEKHLNILSEDAKKFALLNDWDVVEKRFFDALVKA